MGFDAGPNPTNAALEILMPSTTFGGVMEGEACSLALLRVGMLHPWESRRAAAATT